MGGSSRLWCVELPESPFNTDICLCLEFTYSGASLSTSEISAGSVSDRPVRRKLLASDSLYTWYVDPWAPRITETVKYCCKLWEQFLCMFDELKSVEIRWQEGDGPWTDVMSSRFLFRPRCSYFIFSEFFHHLMFSCECSAAVKVHIAFHNDSRLRAGWVRVSSWLCGCGIWLLRPLNGALCVFFEVLLRPDDGGPVVCQLFQRGENTQKLEGVWHKCMQEKNTYTRITELHPSKLSKITARVYFHRENRWWKE